jgi:hypothetical protein
MALGDGIRRDISTVSALERDRFIEAIRKLDTTKFFPDGVSYWDKQEQIHKNAHFNGVDVHGGPAFIPWHRAIVNRLEALLREVDPELSLHYWDWTTDPRVASGPRAALFTPQFMDNASGNVSHLLNDFESTEDAEIGNGHTKIWRDVGSVAANPDGTPAIASDASILNNSDFATFATALKAAHDNVAHSYIGGTISNPHYSFHDPFVFLLHSNLDRIWAKWQTDPAHPERIAPATAYAGLNAAQLNALITEHVEPWAGGTGLEPWASDPTKRAVINYLDLSVVSPPCYDTNSSDFQVVEAENHFNAATSRYQVVFNDVPELETTWRSATFRIRTCGDVNLQVNPGTAPAAPFGVSTPQVLSKAGPTQYREARVWFEFTAGAVGTAPQSLGPVNTTVTVGNQNFDLELVATTIPRPTVAVELALDQSGSMADPAGTSGAQRLEVLKDAAALFANLIQKDNGIGLIRFDDDAYPPNHPTYGGLAISKVTSNGFGDPVRGQALTAIAAHGAHGATSVGDGLAMARSELNALPAGAYTDQAIVVFTDGIQNRPQSIADVASSIDDRTFAVGLGNETQVNTAALTQLAGSTGGALLLSGVLSSSLDDQFRVRKFFLQILAGVSRNDIVVDPVSHVLPGAKVRIPFSVTEADINARVIVLPSLPVLRVTVETPAGDVLDASSGVPGAEFERAAEVTTVGLSLPVPAPAGPAHGGTWYAVLDIDKRAYKKWASQDRDDDPRIRDLRANGAAYCVSVHALSNLRMRTGLTQSGFTPGSTLQLRAVLSEYGVPVEGRARVEAHVTYPDGSQTTLGMVEAGGGSFDLTLPAIIAGVYRITVRAQGGTFRGVPFTREALLTAAVWPGGDRPDPDPTGGSGHDGGGDWCRLLRCVLEKDAFSREMQERWREQGFDIDSLRECLKEICAHE